MNIQEIRENNKEIQASVKKRIELEGRLIKELEKLNDLGESDSYQHARDLLLMLGQEFYSIGYGDGKKAMSDEYQAKKLKK